MSSSVNHAVFHITEAQKYLRGVRIADEEIYEGLMREIRKLNTLALEVRAHMDMPPPEFKDERLAALQEKGAKAREKQIEAMRKAEQERAIQRAQENYRARVSRGLSGKQGDAPCEVPDGRESPQG